jgi:hypothetical protein
MAANAAEQSYGPELQGFTYHDCYSPQGEALDMAYMDMKPPN